MPITSTTTRSEYNGDGATVAFSVGFKYFTNSHVRVIHVDANAVETVWVYGTEYTLSGDGAAATGQVDVETTPTDYTPASGEKLVIRLYPPLLQEDELPSGNYLDDIERIADIMVQKILRLEDDSSRAVRFPEGSSTSDVTIPEPEDGKVLSWSSGVLVNLTPNDSSYLSVSAFALTVLDDTTAAAMRTTIGSGDVFGPGTITDGAYVQFDGTTGTLLKQTTATVQEAGAQTIGLSALGCVSRTTNGAASGSTETSTNDTMEDGYDFDAATSEAIQKRVWMPKSWNEGTVTVAFAWSAASGSGDVVWGCRAKALSDGDSLDGSWGTGVTVTDTLTGTGEICLSAATSAITIGGTPAAEDMVIFEFYRDAASGSDTLAADARLLDIKIIYTTDTANDA